MSIERNRRDLIPRSVPAPHTSAPCKERAAHSVSMAALHTTLLSTTLALSALHLTLSGKDKVLTIAL